MISMLACTNSGEDLISRPSEWISPKR